MFLALREKLGRLNLRLLLVVNNSSLIIFGILFMDLQRTLGQYLYCVGLAAGLEYLIQSFRQTGRLAFLGWEYFWNRIFSGTSAALGCILALNIPDTKWYTVPVVLTVISKILITREDGRHVYNPSNFGIVLSLIFLPDHKAFFLPDQFSASPVPLVQALVVGMIVNIIVNRYWQVISYLAFSCFFSLIFSQVTGFNFTLLVGPDYNAVSIIYLMFMISDPRTSPDSIKKQVLFAASIAFITVLLRWYGSIAHQILALFITSSLFFLANQILTRLRSAPTAPA